MSEFDRLRTTRISRSLRNFFVFLTVLLMGIIVILTFHMIQNTESNQPVIILLAVIAGIILSAFFSFHFHFRFRSRQ
jgi:putative flippase GtrA